MNKFLLSSGALKSKFLLIAFALTVMLPAGELFARAKIRFFTDINASWLVDKAGYSRTSSINPLIKVPLELAWKDRAGRSIGSTPSAADEFIFVSTRDRRIIVLERNGGGKMIKRTFKGGFGGSVLIQGTKMYFNTRAPDGKVYCTEINSKHKNIERNIGPTVVSPIIDQDRMFLFNQYGKIYSMNTDIGFRNWQSQIQGNIEYAPVYQDPYLFVSTIHGKIYKLDSTTGIEVCQTSLGSYLFSDLCSDGFYLYCSKSNGEVFCLEPDSLKKEWSVNLNRPLFSGPVFSDSSLFICSRDGWLIKLSAEDGSVLWQSALDGIAVAPPSLTGEYAFTGTKSGELAAFDSHSGQKLWSQKIEEGISASPLIYRDFVYYCTDRGTVYAFHAK